MAGTSEDQLKVQLANLPNDLRARILKLTQANADAITIFQDLIKHLRPESLAHKKVKLEAVGEVLASLSELSFTAPIRKKLCLQFHPAALSLSMNGRTELVLNYVDIKQILLLETPNKPKLNWSVVITSKTKQILLGNDTITFSFDDVMPKFKITGPAASKEKKARSAIVATINSLVKGNKIEEPSKNVFISSGIKSSNHHIECYHKAKDGVLYLLQSGIFFGFKKPLMFFDIDKIIRMDVAGITNRFFNLHITTSEEGIIEFQMIELQEFDGIGEYITKFIKTEPTIDGQVMTEEVLAPMDVSDADDEDYGSEQHSEGGIAEEFDSDHDSDSGVDSSGEGESDGDSRPNSSGMKNQLAAIERQRAKRKSGKEDDEVDLDLDSDGSDSEDEDNEEEMESGAVEGDEDDEETNLEDIDGSTVEQTAVPSPQRSQIIQTILLDEEDELE